MTTQSIGVAYSTEPALTRIHTNLPPPYTWTGARAGELRANPQDFTCTTTILVGPKLTPFSIHTSLLTSQSPYFRAALTGPFVESKSKTITLDDVNPDHFSLLVAWLYTSAVPAPFKDGKPAYYTLLHLYSLADRLCMEGLRNAVVDLIADLADQTNSVLTPSDTRILYDGIRDSAPLRDLVLDLFAFKKTDRLVEGHVDAWHAAFLRDLCVLLKRPCAQALLRHRLRMWCPDAWHGARSCDYCRAVLKPRCGAVACDDCCLSFCTTCVEGGVAVAGWDDGRGREADEMLGAEKRKGGKWEACKPWRGARCALYHEHDETERCGDIFMGR
ncbi:uncharacterized protein M421DRAFT_4659 [Didymella exigua CBS 183.55]|uniref:BTB domain-containing protein n=1 Tax=Didymella exigua CBS 183.55 TaxID=1150837 RepID=A0A6A5RMD6_9PLEO|nr:uncharacterized protein M421DRAFT_4659 [Didymella exigua CBS 183.55]KAF1928819.1 hypothetical protein M421DRAFT_4659 [Didymella exigua CBS 183.55]